MDARKCRESEQINICDDLEVDRLSDDLKCHPTDVYEAIAFVGDRICCIRSQVQKTLALIASQHDGRIEVCDLPPLWGDVEAESA